MVEIPRLTLLIEPLMIYPQDEWYLFQNVCRHAAASRRFEDQLGLWHTTELVDQACASEVNFMS